MPAVGVDRFSGVPSAGFDGALQRLDRLWSTRIGAYPMLRGYGSITAELLGRRLVPSLIPLYQYGLWLAAETWEPCASVASVVAAKQEINAVMLGDLYFDIALYYMPNGHLGDRTIEGGLRRVQVGGSQLGTNARLIGA